MGIFSISRDPLVSSCAHNDVCVLALQQVRAVFRLLEHLCPRLGRASLDVLYSHLRNLPPQYEEMHVQLIQRFAEAASGWGNQCVSVEKAPVSDGEMRRDER